MTTRVCSELGCEKPLRARGLCSTHYNQTDPNRHRRSKTCEVCAAEYVTTRTNGRFCSLLCRDLWRVDQPADSMYRRTVSHIASLVPDDHPSRSTPIPLGHARWWIGSSTPVPYNHPARRILCIECGDRPARWDGALYCSTTCARRIHKRRRRAREYEQLGMWTWSDFTRLCLTLGNCCAYCGVAGVALEPDHVLALSRGGHNTISNLLPACRACNGQKRNLTLDEWQEERVSKGLPPRRCDVSGYIHLALRHAHPALTASRGGG